MREKKIREWHLGSLNRIINLKVMTSILSHLMVRWMMRSKKTTIPLLLLLPTVLPSVLQILFQFVNHSPTTNQFILNSIKSTRGIWKWNESCVSSKVLDNLIEKIKLERPQTNHPLLDPALQGQIKQLMIILSTTAWLGTTQPVSISRLTLTSQRNWR